MGSKRIGLARTQTLLENLRRELKMGGSVITSKVKVTALGDGGGDVQLTAEDCGYITIGNVGVQTAVSKGYNIDLPAPASGLYYKIVFVGPSIASNANAAITVTSNSDNESTAANLIVGALRGAGDDQGANVTAVADVITFVHAKATAGDYAELFCDGTNWIMDAYYDADDAITLT